MASANTAGQPSADWDEERCISALAQLESLQNQLTNLRLAIPRVVEPLHSSAPIGPAIFKAFKEGLVGSQNGIKLFRAQWHSEEVQSAFEHSKQSFNRNSDLSAATQVPPYGWIQAEIATQKVSKRKRTEEQIDDDKYVALPQDEVFRLVHEFSKIHPVIKVGSKDKHSDLMIQFVASSLTLRFHVVLEREANGRHKLNVDCLGSTEPFMSIARCVASRPQANDLKYLLDMIAAYKTTKAATCTKCSKVLDSSGLTSTGRRSKLIEGANGAPETVWEAFHESCLD
ncbi:hypothetical protein BDV95DRAFT_543900 [Massariosphaeria phaeospora]|uniref:Mediator complex subunit 27-domain-containing protein n=1 Tax=Massariosphaeria phaeospora TaxID=100035 RepID=A0A7C8MCU4_9PLEO|nr:hypothetical protein BDV95DRAFT_543900 [Massariosphaeria phaeospora]